MFYLTAGVYTLVAAYIGWIWIDYYRLIDAYDKTNLKYFILTFLLGAASIFLVDLVDRYILSGITLELNNDAFNDLAYFIVKVGLVEEACKAVPFVIIFFAFRSQFKEPLDYIAFFSISALGFSSAENVEYFIYTTKGIFVGRAIISSVGHMFYSAFIAYGIVLVKYKAGANKLLAILGCVTGAIVCHAVFDFLAVEGGSISVLGSLAFFLLTVSAYTTMINNALNNAKQFSYKMVTSDKVTTQIVLYYLILFVIQFGVSFAQKNFIYALSLFFSTLIFIGLLVMIVVMRLSRLKLIPGRWEPIKIELPFTAVSDLQGVVPTTGFNVKGESPAEATLNKYFEEYITINPILKAANSTKSRIAFIYDRVFLEKDISFQRTKLFTDDKLLEYKVVLLRSKTKDKIFYQDKYPLAALYTLAEDAKLDDPTLTTKQLRFIEWVYVKPYKLEGKT